MLKHQAEAPSHAEHNFAVPRNETAEAETRVTEAEQAASTPVEAKLAAVDTLLATLKKQLRLQLAFRFGAGALFLTLLLFVLIGLLTPLAPETLYPVFQIVSSLYPFKATVHHDTTPTTYVDPTASVLVTTTYFDLITPLLLILGCLLLGGMARRQRGKITRLLTQHNDVRAVGPLAQALEMKNKQVMMQAADALIRLLPQLQVGDTPLLDTKQRACLHGVLRGEHRVLIGRVQSELVLSILKAFARIGDARDLSAIEALAQRLAEKPGDEAASIRPAIHDTLAAIQQRLRQQHDEKTLLRGSQRDTSADPNELLRGILPDRP